MNIYPAMRATMGRWQYYMVKMSMRELNDTVKFAADIYDDRTLDDAIQRVLNESRVKSDLVTYLVRQQDRFFSSIVVAAMGGHPQWYPVTMESDDRFAIFRDNPRLNETFGVLSFDGQQDYYALDGQHRLAAIKALVDPASDAHPDAPAGFKDEEMSVIVVVPSAAESEEDFLERYRRLFGNLNRYAKPMEQVDNIIMDEDDAFAIITRRLITAHPFFQYSGRQKESVRVKTTKSKNLKSGDSYFTSLETLYELNIALLSTMRRKNNGWDGVKQDDKNFRRFRPTDDVLETLFQELSLYWDALIEVLPVLSEPPVDMRDHSAPSGDGKTRDNILFWPIGQELLAKLARDLMNIRLPDPERPTAATARKALKGLGELNWEFHRAPWRNLLLIPDRPGSTTWRIRSEDRKLAQALARRIVRWQLGMDELSEEEIAELRDDWEGLLLPALDADTVNELWEEIESSAVR